MFDLVGAYIGGDSGPGLDGVAQGAAAYWWLLIPLLPLAGAVSLALLRRDRRRPGIAEGVSATALCTAVAGLLGLLWLTGVPQGTVSLGGLVGRGLVFRVTPMGLLFAMFATGLWALAAFFSISYLAGGHAHRRYYFYFLLSLSGTVGVFFAGNLFTLFVFFELVSLGSYPLVVHEETEEAMSAGRLYLYMGIAGGLVLLLGTMWLDSLNGGDVAIGAVLEPAGPLGPWAAAAVLLVLGFGVKAGMFPVHIWLPRAHPVAPSPASALLSGVMIKTGAYGIYQVVRMFTGGGTSAASGLETAAGAAGAASPDLGHAIGLALVGFALTTLFLGALLALIQTNAKRVLAYSSVSQMGYILLGAGMAGVLGSGEAMGASGFAFHVLNHALFKSTMFMLIGVVYLKTGELDIRRLGGLARHLPLTATVFGMAVLAIAGLPGLCGYASKTLLHDAILVLRHDLPGALWPAVEWLFTIGGGLTFAYTAKLWYFVFLRRPEPAAGAVRPAVGRAVRPDDDSAGEAVRETFPDKVLAIALGLPLLLIGLFPAGVVSRLIAPFALSSGFGHDALHHVETVHFFGWEAVRGALTSLGIGAVAFVVLGRLGFPHPEIRRGPSVEGSVLRPLVRLLAKGCLAFAAFDRFIDSLFVRATGAGFALVGRIARVDVAVDSAFLGMAEGGARVVEAFTALDREIDRGVEQTAEGSARLVRGAERADRAVDRGFDLMARGAARTVRTITSVDREMDRTWEEAAAQSAQAVRGIQSADRAIDRVYTRAAELGRDAVRGLDPDGRGDQDVEGVTGEAASGGGTGAEDAPAEKAADGVGGAGAQAGARGRSVEMPPDSPQVMEDARRRESRHLWTLMNLNIATLLMAALIGLMLLIFILWR